MSPSAKTRDALPERMREAFATLNADPAMAAAGMTYAALADVPWGEIDLVIESVTENLALKQRLFAALEELARPGVPLVTNTSTFQIGDIASGLRPETRKRVAGLHYFVGHAKFISDIAITGGRPEVAASICKHPSKRAKKSGLMRPRTIVRSSQRRL